MLSHVPDQVGEIGVVPNGLTECQVAIKRVVNAVPEAASRGASGFRVRLSQRAGKYLPKVLREADNELTRIGLWRETNRDKLQRRAETGGQSEPTSASGAGRERQRGLGPIRKPLPEKAIETKKAEALGLGFCR